MQKTGRIRTKAASRKPSSNNVIVVVVDIDTEIIQFATAYNADLYAR